MDEPPPLAENAKLKTIGKPINRMDAIEKVTGKARYTFDVQLPGMLWGRWVTSPLPHARVKSVDTSAAERYPGVRAVHVLERVLSIAKLRDPKAEQSQRYPTVRYAGQPIAAVAADGDLPLADAVALVDVVRRCFDRQHPLPTDRDYDLLRSESPEMAWIATEGNASTASAGSTR